MSLLSTVCKICVRTSIINSSGVKDNQGSGVIIKVQDDFYVVTTYHCINGENDEYLNFPPESICIEYQSTYKTPFIPLEVNSIVNFNKTDDWMLLSIGEPQIDIDFSIIQLGENFIEEPVNFIGFQNANSESHRPFKAKILTISNDEFRINLSGDTFEQHGEDGAYIAKGLSGSPVFIERTDRVYLIGMLKSVIGENALNDDINCIPMSLIKLDLQIIFHDMLLIATSGIWEDSTERACIEQDVREWTKLNDKYFKRFLRKNKVLYKEEKVDKIISRSIITFLQTEYRLDQIRRQSNLVQQFEEVAVLFEEEVKDNYTRDCYNRNEAKDLLIKLKSDFKVHIADLIGDNSNKTTMELANHKVTEWLMNCSFDFND